MTDEALYCDPELAQLYDWDNPWPEDFEFFAGLAAGASRVLDLGCGTGIFSAELAARGHEVTGADPAEAMLQIARHRHGGGLVRWIEADARSLELGECCRNIFRVRRFSPRQENEPHGSGSAICRALVSTQVCNALKGQDLIAEGSALGTER